MRRVFSLFIFCALCAPLGLRAAAPEVAAHMSPDSIAIGDRFTLDVTVDKDVMQVVEFPVFEGRKFGEAIEIIHEYDTDTTSVDGRRMTLRKRYVMTSFDAGEYEIDGFPVLYADKNIIDTLFSSEPLRLSVGTFQIDTAQSTIYDIKRPEAAPMLVSEVSGYFITAIVALCTLAAAIIVITTAIKRRRRNRGAAPAGLGPAEPPHEKAIRELEALRGQRMWQNQKHKLYYSRLSDILRGYLEGRYGVQAMEMTTGEIMGSVERLMQENDFVSLRNILHTADLVKFAKLIPEADRNEELYYKAYYFVENTRELPLSTEDAEEEQQQNE